MPPVRQSNVERRRGRDECRRKLAQHIYENLGVAVKPSEVRLNPRETDFYAWRFVPGKEEIFSKIFSKSLSDHSIGTFRLLCKEIGKSFEAVLSLQSSTSDIIVPISTQKPSFSSLISQLQEENAKLYTQIQKVTSEKDAECKRNQIFEKENKQLCNDQAWLEKQVQDQADMAEYFRRILAKCAEDMDKSLPALEGLRKQIAESRIEGYYTRPAA
ncbi:hypothetical protein RB600_000834 [Gaeumannomyces tritici]